MLNSETTERELTPAHQIKIPPKSLSDAQIVQQIKAGDIDAYGSIMRRYNQRLYRIVRSIVTDNAAAMDIVQEAHIKAYTKINEFHNADRFAHWLARIARNEALMYIRKYKKEVLMTSDELEFINEESSHMNSPSHTPKRPDDFLANKQLQHLLNSNIDYLPKDFRSVFVLRSIEHLSVKETAAILEIKEETVKTRYFRAKRILRSQIQSYLESASMQVYEFGGHHCDRLINHVLKQIHNPKL